MQAGVPDIRAEAPSGPANHVLQTCRHLARLGHQVQVVACLDKRIWKSGDLVHFSPACAGWPDSVPFKLGERCVRGIQSRLRLPYVAFFDNLRFARACEHALKGYDLLYERMGWMGGGGHIAAGRLGIPHVLEINGDHLREHEMLGIPIAGLQRQLSLRLMRRVTRGAAHAVATGEGWRQRHLENWKVDPARVSVIQNGSEVVDLLSRRELRCYREQRSPEEALHLVYVGSFDPWQSLPSLVRAVARAAAGGADVRLSLAGRGVVEEEVKQAVNGLRIGQRVKFAGHLDMAALLRLLQQADAGIALYRGREEFTGLKLLDYKSAGLATIAAGRDGQPSLIRHGITGLIVPPDDEDALVDAIVELSRSPERVVEMGRQARLEAEQGHSWRHSAEALDRLFHSITRGRQRRAEGELRQAGSAVGNG